MEERKAMALHADIWRPNSGSFLKQENTDKLEFMKSLGRTMWNHACSPILSVREKMAQLLDNLPGQ